MLIQRKHVPAFGLVFGLVFGYAAFGMTAVGHGTYAFLALASSPIALAGLKFALFSSPLLWLAIGLLMTKVHHPIYRNMFILVMVAHYTVAAYLVIFLSPYSDWQTTASVLDNEPLAWVFFALASLTYLLAQAGIWSLASLFSNPSRDQLEIRWL